MKPRLKPIAEQVILITGASSGIGLCAARMAAARGAKVMLVARSEQTLHEAVENIKNDGGEAACAVADVANLDELRRAADAAVDRFGRIDTWVNNAGVSIYGRVDEVKLEDDKRLFETNFWGVVNGSRLAMEYLKPSEGGSIINVGSIVSDRAVPLQGMYSASKHAVQGFTDALRMEVEEARLPISVTLIKPAAINTPYLRHAKNYMDVQPTFPPPVYAPEVVAEQILHAAAHPVRDLYAGGGGRLMAGLGKQMPRLMDWIMESTMFRQQRTNRPAGGYTQGALHAASNEEHPHASGDADRDRTVRSHSAYGPISRHPLATVAMVAVAGAVAAAALVALTSPVGRRGGASLLAALAAGGGRRGGLRGAALAGLGAEVARRGRQAVAERFGRSSNGSRMH